MSPLFPLATLAASLAVALPHAGRFAWDPQPATDSIRVVRRVADAQRSFEAFRRNRLPIAAGVHDQCDVRVGRYCYWRGDDDDEEPGVEPASIREQRDELIRTLDSASQALPGDAWLAGQLVRYLVEAGRPNDAVGFASSQCHATAAWCAALTGYAAHIGGRFEVADSAFALALAAMDSSERCKWFDISDLLDDELAGRFQALDCSARERFARRLFWMGAPLYSVSETDLLTEYLARLTRARIAEHAAAPDGEAWADDIRALVVRYGWPRWYTRTPAAPGSLREASYTGHDAGLPYCFLPSARAFDHIGRTTTADWSLDDPQARTGYAPVFARSMHDLPSQIATFRRGDSTLVVAAWDARKDTTLLGRQLDAALALTDGNRSAIARQSMAGSVGRISATGIVDSGLVSLELLAVADRRAARIRIGIATRPSNRIALSDLLLHAPVGAGGAGSAGSAGSAALATVIDSALATATIVGGRQVGVYWETYGLRAQGEPVQFTLTVEPVAGNWLRRAAERLHFTDPSRESRLHWEEVPQKVHGVAARDLRLDLSTLRPGRYRIDLSVITRIADSVVTSREIELR
ncbi:MAG TPA: hypothetical protein VII52_02615 [Gemmatimonadaceae bacterium]